MHPENILSVKILDLIRFFQCLQLDATLCRQVLTKLTIRRWKYWMGSPRKISPNLEHKTYINLCRNILLVVGLEVAHYLLPSCWPRGKQSFDNLCSVWFLSIVCHPSGESGQTYIAERGLITSNTAYSRTQRWKNAATALAWVLADIPWHSSLKNLHMASQTSLQEPPTN